MIQWPRPQEMVALYDKEQQEFVKITLIVNLKLFRAIFLQFSRYVHMWHTWSKTHFVINIYTPYESTSVHDQTFHS